MNNIDKLNLSLGLIKQASPRWARSLKSLSAESLDKLKNYFPADYARQVGKKRLGRGMEGIVYPAFVGQKGEAIVKHFDTDLSKGWNKNISGAPGFSDLNVSFIPVAERGKALQAIENPGLLDVYKPTNTGYFAERLFDLPRRKDVYLPSEVMKYLKAKRRFLAADKLLNRYNSAVDSYRKEHPIKGYFLNLFKNKTDKLLNKKIEDSSQILKKFDVTDTRNLNINIDHAKQLSRLYNSLISPGTKPVSYRDILSYNLRPEKLFGKFYEDTGLIKTKGGNQAGKPFYIGDVDFDKGHNIMRRADGRYVISDPSLAVADY